MFSTVAGVLTFLAGAAMTVGLLLAPHVMPGGWGDGIGWTWTLRQILWAAGIGLALLTAVLWLGGRMVREALSWKEPRVIGAAILIALTANLLFMCLVEWFRLPSGWRALVAVLGVPVIYGNLGRVLGKTTLAKSMDSILTGALATMGAGFIAAALIRGW